MKITITSLLLLIGFHLLAQPSLRDLENYISQARKNSSIPIPPSVLSDNRNEDKLIAFLVPYLSDTVSDIRSKSYYIIKRVGQKSASPAVRASAIGYLVKGIRDNDTGISGNASSALTGFKKTDFSQAHRDSIANLLTIKTPHAEQIFRLAGYLDMNNQQDKLNAVINSSAAFKYKWAARLALARLGDQPSIGYIMGKLGNAPINDDFVYDVVPDLVYTRQSEIFKFLEGIVQSDKADCQSANPDSNQKILCGYRVMEYLASAIKEYPLQIDESGDLEVRDYEQALKTVRTWLTQNPGYSIVRDSY